MEALVQEVAWKLLEVQQGLAAVHWTELELATV
jgi:hypothetical protein